MTAKFKAVISDPRNGTAVVAELEGAKAQALIGRSIDEIVDGTVLGLKQKKLLIRGGSDKDGIPLRPDVHGAAKKYVVLSGGPGFKPTRHGERRRKLLRGRTISEDTYQINMVAVEESKGDAPLPLKPASEEPKKGKKPRSVQ